MFRNASGAWGWEDGANDIRDEFEALQQERDRLRLRCEALEHQLHQVLANPDRQRSAEHQRAKLSVAEDSPWCTVGPESCTSFSHTLQVSSDLTCHRPRTRPHGNGVFTTFCPCCRRPITLTLVKASPCENPVGAPQAQTSEPCAMSPRASEEAGGSTKRLKLVVRKPLASRCAYVSLLYGREAAAGYGMGVLALGQSLRECCVKHDRVLMHTNDVPTEMLEMIRTSGLWELVMVDYIHGSYTMGKMGCDGWRGIFTKLQLFSLTQYSRVLFLDADVLALQNLDHLFDLSVPAATLKGSWQPMHGELIDGSSFFPAPGVWNEPHGGINAGVMLLEPNLDIHEQMLNEVTDDWHPEHIHSYGPEQEYLSRFFADRWHHIAIDHNFQLYRCQCARAIRRFFGDSAAAMTADEICDSIKAVQFSSYPKPWGYVCAPDEFSDRLNAQGIEISSTDPSMPQPICESKLLQDPLPLSSHGSGYVTAGGTTHHVDDKPGVCCLAISADTARQAAVEAPNRQPFRNGEAAEHVEAISRTVTSELLRMWLAAYDRAKSS